MLTTTMVDNIPVRFCTGVTQDDAIAIGLEEKELWAQNGKELARVNISVDGDNYVVETFEKSPVKRVRRITGYLSNMTNFNESKADELGQRVAHM